MTYPTKEVYVTCAYGVPGKWAAGKHTGTDYRAAVGTNLFATRGGVVEQVGWGSLGSAYGFYVLIRCVTEGGQTRKALYAHMSSSPLRVGQTVGMGDFIGRSGDTGNTSGPHLHYEERTSPYGYYNYAPPVFPFYQKKKPLVAVKLSKLRPGAKKSLSAAIVRRRLRRKGIAIKRGRKFDEDLKKAYAKWQQKLGFDGADANGIPGEYSLEKLGLRAK